MKVSVSAQLATFPLACMLFHQFPLYFILTNLIAVPLSSIVIYTGMLAEASVFSDLIPHIFMFLFKWLLYFFNTFISWVDALPGSYIDQINLNFPEMILLYIGIISFYSWLKKKSFKSFIILIFMIMIFSTQFIFRHYNENKQVGIVCYSQTGHTAIDMIEGKSSWLYCDKQLRNDSLFERYILKPARQNFGIVNPDLLNDVGSGCNYFRGKKSGNVIIYGGKSVFILKKGEPLFETGNKLKIDYLLISDSPYYSIDDILKSIRPGKVIVDASNYNTKSVELKKECLAAGIPFYNTVENGAFIEFW